MPFQLAAVLQLLSVPAPFQTFEPTVVMASVPAVARLVESQINPTGSIGRLRVVKFPAKLGALNSVNVSPAASVPVLWLTMVSVPPFVNAPMVTTSLLAVAEAFLFTTICIVPASVALVVTVRMLVPPKVSELPAAVLRLAMVWLKPDSTSVAPLEMGTVALAPMQLVTPQMTVPA